MGRKIKTKSKSIDSCDQQLTSRSISNIDWFHEKLAQQSTRTLIITLLVVYYYFVYLGNYNLINFLVSNSIGLIVGRGSCSIVIPSSWSKLFHPPVNCSKCETINEIAEVTNITSEQFESRFVKKLTIKYQE